MTRAVGIRAWALRCAVLLLAGGGSYGCTVGEVADTLESVAEVASAEEGCLQIDGRSFCTTSFGTRHNSICTVSGSVEAVGNGYRVHSNGEGLSLDNAVEDCCGPGSETCTDPDGVTFVFTTVNDAEDLEIRARLTRVTDRMSAQAGIMLRTSVAEAEAASAHAAALFVSPQTGCATSMKSVNVLKRFDLIPGVNAVENSALPIRNEYPIWLRIQKRGKDFAASRSQDGKVWVPVSGGPFVSNQAHVGFFAAGAGQDVDATFEDIYVGPLLPDYGPGVDQPVTSTSYIGSSFVRYSGDYVSFGMHGFYVAPDGTSYKYSQATDPINSLDIILPGGTLKQVLDDKIWGFYQGGITGELTQPAGCNTSNNGTQYLYLATRSQSSACAPGSQIRKTDRDAAPLVDLDPSLHHHHIHDSNVAFDMQYGKLGVVNGLAARNGTLYVSELQIPDTLFCPQNWPFTGRIRRTSAAIINRDGTGGSESPPIDFSQYGKPGPLAVDDAGNIWVIRSATPQLSYWNFGAQSIQSSHYPSFNIDDGAAGSIVCLKASDGTPCVQNQAHLITGTQVGYGATDRFNPVGVTLVQNDPGTCVDDELLIADNGPKQNIFRCSGLTGVPSCVPFGADGGVFSGESPGLINDPAAGGDRRFFSPLAAGQDACGNVLVASSAPRVDIRRFNATTQVLDWAVYGLSPEAGAFDPATDGADYYTVSLHHAFHPTEPAPWSPKAVTANPFDDTPATVGHRHDDGLSPGSTIKLYARRMASDPNAPMSAKHLYTYQLTWPPKSQYQLHFYRFTKEASGGGLASSEIATRFGSFTFIEDKDNNDDPNLRACLRLWQDKDADGEDDSNLVSSPFDSPGCEKCADPGAASCEREVVVFKNRYAGDNPPPSDADIRPSGAPSPFVDRDGTIWVSWGGKVWELPPTGWVHSGLYPVYSLDDIDWSEASPNGYQVTAAIGGASIFDAEHDTLYHYTSSRTNRPDPECQVASPPCWCADHSETIDRITDFHGTKQRSAPYPLALPVVEPLAADDFLGRIYFDAECSSVCGEFGYRSWEIVGEMLFMQERVGPIHVFNVNTGQKLAILFAGAEASSYQGWADTHMPGYMHAFKRANGEYLVTTMDSSDQARTLVFRWTPPSEGPWTPQSLAPRAWYVASNNDLDTDANGTVSRWQDRTSNDLDLIQDNPWGRPSYLPAGWNGSQPTVRFANKLLRRDDWSGPPAGVGQAFTLLAVVQPDTNQGQTTSIAGFWNGWDGVRLNVVPSGAQNLLQAFRLDSLGSNQTFSSSLSLGGDRHVIAWRYVPGTPEDTFVLDLDADRESQAVTPIGNTAVNAFFVGTPTAYANGQFQGNISELVLVPRAISDEEVGAFRAYAQDKWDGLP